MEFLIKGLVVTVFFITVGCSSTPKETVGNNKKMARIVLALKSSDFDRAYDILDTLRPTKPALFSRDNREVIFYKVYGWDKYNPQRAFELQTLKNYLYALGNVYKEISECAQVSKESASAYGSAMSCFERVKKEWIERLQGKAFTSGSYSYNFNKTRCFKEPKFCSVFGRIVEDSNLVGAGVFVEYWVNRMLPPIEERYRILSKTERKDSILKKASDKRREKAFDRIRQKLSRNNCELFSGAIVQKFNNHRYEVSYLGGYEKGLSCEVRRNSFLGCKYHGILKTVSTVFPSTGILPGGISVKAMGREKVRTLDGFDQVWEVFKESELCKKIRDEANYVK